MKTFKITVPYTYVVSGSYEHDVTEQDVLDYFEVDDLDQITTDELHSYLCDTAEYQTYNISDDQVCQLVREQKGLETEPDDITIEELEAAE